MSVNIEIISDLEDLNAANYAMIELLNGIVFNPANACIDSDEAFTAGVGAIQYMLRKKGQEILNKLMEEEQ